MTTLFKNFGFNEVEAIKRARVGYFALMGFWERGERDQEFVLSMQEFSNFLLALLPIAN